MSDDASFDNVMSRLRAGDAAAAREVFSRYASSLIGLARIHMNSRLRQKVDPEDVALSACKSFFVRFADGQFDLDSWDNLWTLLTVITVRKCRGWKVYYRAGKRSLSAEVPLPSGGEDSGSSWEVLADEPTPSEAAMLTETLEGLVRELQGRDRDILTLALQGHTPVEISRQLGRPERTVYRVLERIRKRLQQQGDADQV